MPVAIGGCRSGSVDVSRRDHEAMGAQDSECYAAVQTRWYTYPRPGLSYVATTLSRILPDALGDR